ncbi:MAG: hypothetical protein ACLVFE_01690 [Bifidobacterium adolescentis]
MASSFSTSILEGHVAGPRRVAAMAAAALAIPTASRSPVPLFVFN